MFVADTCGNFPEKSGKLVPMVQSQKDEDLEGILQEAAVHYHQHPEDLEPDADFVDCVLHDFDSSTVMDYSRDNLAHLLESHGKDAGAALQPLFRYMKTYCRWLRIVQALEQYASVIEDCLEELSDDEEEPLAPLPGSEINPSIFG